MLEERQIRLQPSEFSEEEVYMAMGYRGTTPEPDICAPCAPLRIPDHPLPTVCVPSHPFALTWLPPAEGWITSADLRK